MITIRIKTDNAAFTDNKGGDKMKVFIIALVVLSCNIALAGSWTSYDYGTHSFTSGEDTTVGGRTSGRSYDYGKGTFTSYDYKTDSRGHTSGSSYDFGTNTFKSFESN